MGDKKPMMQKFCKDSPQQLCKMKCPPMKCQEGQCIMRQGSCCSMQCMNEDKPKPEVKWCKDSPQQMCRMMCNPKPCDKGMCMMRKGTCCDMSCVKDEDE